MYDRYDLVVIGQGSAAFAAAIKANELGIKVAMIGRNETKGAVVGGTCVNVGCVPSKNLITVGTRLYESNGNAPHFQSIDYGKSKLNFRRAIREKDLLVRRFRNEKYRNVLDGLENVDYIPELASFISSREVKAGTKIIRAEKFLIAVGARAKPLDVKGIEEVSYLTNEEALNLKELPKSMIIIGGRALGLEFAQMYSHFGTKVTILQKSDRLLPEDEPEISEALKFYLEQEGIAIYTGVEIVRLSNAGKMKKVEANISGKNRTFRAEQLLLATGRKPNIDLLHPEKAGVELDDKGFVKVNQEMQTSAPNVWAAGDVIGEPMLEAFAAKQGEARVLQTFLLVLTFYLVLRNSKFSGLSFVLSSFDPRMSIISLPLIIFFCLRQKNLRMFVVSSLVCFAFLYIPTMLYANSGSQFLGTIFINDFNFYSYELIPIMTIISLAIATCLVEFRKMKARSTKERTGPIREMIGSVGDQNH